MNKIHHSQEYLNSIKEIPFKRMDCVQNGGNGDGKISTKEALKDLNIGSLFVNQNAEDATKIWNASQNIDEVLEQYAGEDGEFSAEEWADFLNGEEWGSVMDAWHSSGRKAQLEMKWTDDAAIKDGETTKGEVKVGLMRNLFSKGIQKDTTDIEDLVDKYAGEDGTFSISEYRAMLNDPEYKNFVQQNGVVPWFNPKMDWEV